MNHIDSVVTLPVIPRYGVILDPRELSVLLPITGVVSGFRADVLDGGDLHAVVPDGRTLYRQTVTDVHAPVPGHPETFAGNQLVPSDAGHGVALGDHAVGGDIRHAA